MKRVIVSSTSGWTKVVRGGTRRRRGHGFAEMEVCIDIVLSDFELRTGLSSSRSDGELCTVLVLADFKGCEQRSTPKAWPLEAHREAESCNFTHLLYADLLDLPVIQRHLTIALFVLGCSLTRNMTCHILQPRWCAAFSGKNASY